MRIGLAHALGASALLAATAVLAVVYVATAHARTAAPRPHPVSLAWSTGAREIGRASWYGSESGTTTASGEHFNPDGRTCATACASGSGSREATTCSDQKKAT